MADLRIRNLDKDIIIELKHLAQIHGHTLECELRELLTKHAMRPRRELAKRAAELRASIKAKSGILTDSAAFIREERDRRG